MPLSNANTETVRMHSHTLSSMKSIGICLRIPKSIQILLEIVLVMLPDELCKAFPNTLLLRMRKGADLTRIDRQFLIWLLSDPIYGLDRIGKRTDTVVSILAALQILQLQATGTAVCEAQRRHAKSIADAAQKSAWDDYQTPRSRNHLARAEWMAASAVAHTLEEHPSCLTGAVQSAAVAWCTAIDGTPLALANSYYQAIHDQVLELFEQAPLSSLKLQGAAMKKQAAVGDPVTFDDPQDGPQKGIITKIVTTTSTPFAVIEIDQNKESAPWQIPLDQLRIEARAA